MGLGAKGATGIMGAIGADLCAAVLSEWFGCDVEVVFAGITVCALLIPAAGYLVYADRDFTDWDWDRACAVIPSTVSVDYASGDWDIVHSPHFLDPDTEAYWYPLSSANIRCNRSSFSEDQVSPTTRQ